MELEEVYCTHNPDRGLMVLLPKKGDQTMIGNKRGPTLLNCALKLLTKLYQVRTTLVLQNFITKQQNAFLPGRSIHHALLLINGVLKKAKESGEDFFCLSWIQ